MNTRKVRDDVIGPMVLLDYKENQLGTVYEGDRQSAEKLPGR